MNFFNFIYMLKVRSGVIGSNDNDYLKFEEVIRKKSAAQNNERLEDVVFQASEVK